MDFFLQKYRELFFYSSIFFPKSVFSKLKKPKNFCYYILHFGWWCLCVHVRNSMSFTLNIVNIHRTILHVLELHLEGKKIYFTKTPQMKERSRGGKARGDEGLPVISQFGSKAHFSVDRPALSFFIFFKHTLKWEESCLSAGKKKKKGKRGIPSSYRSAWSCPALLELYKEAGKSMIFPKSVVRSSF